MPYEEDKAKTLRDPHAPLQELSASRVSYVAEMITL